MINQFGVATAGTKGRLTVDQHTDFQLDQEAHTLAIEGSDECGGSLWAAEEVVANKDSPWAVTNDIVGVAAESLLYTVAIGVPYPTFLADAAIGGCKVLHGSAGS